MYHVYQIKNSLPEKLHEQYLRDPLFYKIYDDRINKLWAKAFLIIISNSVIFRPKIF